jgi:hypothetical protein
MFRRVVLEQVIDSILNLLYRVVEVVGVLLVILRPAGRLLQIENALTRLSKSRLEGARARSDIRLRFVLLLVGKVETPARAGCGGSILRRGLSVYRFDSRMANGRALDV